MIVSALAIALFQFAEAKIETTVMGTILEIKVWDENKEKAQRAVKAAEKEIRRVEDLMTDWRPSPLMDLNAQAGNGWQKVDQELCILLSRARGISKLTDGAFDPSFASAGDLWDFKSGISRVPSPELVRESLKYVGWEKYQVRLKDFRVQLDKGCKIGLGGIAKGYGVDRAMQVLLDLGIKHAIVNAGGDLKALGKKYGTELWNISILHPRERERIIAKIPVSNTCVVTSGDYENFFVVDEERYHHILDPRTGMPAKACISATVIAQDAAFADALATALCVLNPSDGMKLVDSLENVEALLVAMDESVLFSKGLSVIDAETPDPSGQSRELQH